MLSDDFHLCNRVFCRILDRHGDNTKLDSFSNEERVVVAVWGASGLIGNGGFKCLLEGYHDNDPSFAHTAASFLQIGSASASDAFVRLRAIFPDNEIPDDFDTRHRLFDSVPESVRHAIESQFYRADEEIEILLASFIRSNAESLRSVMPIDAAPTNS